MKQKIRNEMYTTLKAGRSVSAFGSQQNAVEVWENDGVQYQVFIRNGLVKSIVNVQTGQAY